jgi:hypothetical protein
VVEGCTVPGSRKLLRFDFLCWNAGDADLPVGNPANHPEWFEFSPCHGHFHLKDFNGYKLIDCAGREVAGNKQAFCMIDLQRISGTSPPRFTDCNTNQGISAGWADVYGSHLDCQWIDITGLPDGDYVLEARTNRNGLLGEDWYGDNFTWSGVRITGSNVVQIDVPCYPEDCLGFNPDNVQAVNIGGRWKVVDGSHWILDFGTSQANAEKARDPLPHAAPPGGRRTAQRPRRPGSRPAGAPLHHHRRRPPRPGRSTPRPARTLRRTPVMTRGLSGPLSDSVELAALRAGRDGGNQTCGGAGSAPPARR